jgi:uncharacterized membrane protein YfcA
MEYVAVGLVVFLGGIVSGFAGFAFSAVTGAILLHFIDPLFAVPFMMLCSIVTQIVAFLAQPRFFSLRESIPMLLGGCLGVPLALLVLTEVSPHSFRAGFGIFLVAYAAYMLGRPAAKLVAAALSPLTYSAVGFAGGFVGGLTAMPGAVPVIWCELNGMPKDQQRGMLQPFILGMQLLALAVLMFVPGGIYQSLFHDVLAMIPFLAAGTFVGIRMFGRVDQVVFRYVVLLLLILSGATMVF